MPSTALTKTSGNSCLSKVSASGPTRPNGSPFAASTMSEGRSIGNCFSGGIEVTAHNRPEARANEPTTAAKSASLTIRPHIVSPGPRRCIHWAVSLKSAEMSCRAAPEVCMLGSIPGGGRCDLRRSCSTLGWRGSFPGFSHYGCHRPAGALGNRCKAAVGFKCPVNRSLAQIADVQGPAFARGRMTGAQPGPKRLRRNWFRSAQARCCADRSGQADLCEAGVGISLRCCIA